ncbi:protein of unknown function [Burkholderia multivorans]
MHGFHLISFVHAYNPCACMVFLRQPPKGDKNLAITPFVIAFPALCHNLFERMVFVARRGPIGAAC